MANLIRSAKSGSDWSLNELLAYKISIQFVPADDFFLSATEVSLEGLVDPSVLTLPPGADDPQISKATAQYLGYLDLATSAGRENAIDDFAIETLKLLEFNEHNSIIITRGYHIPLAICGDSNRTAQTDVCVLHRPTLILLVLVEDKTELTKADPEPQIVAEAIAAFQFNNHKRASRDLPTLNSMTIPCITMAGTRPTFYLVPVTQDLSDAVINGQYPVAETKVLKCVTTARHIRRVSVGMDDTEYRALALRRFLRFKALAKIHWEPILQGY